jgi:predicted amidohydrolase
VTVKGWFRNQAERARLNLKSRPAVIRNALALNQYARARPPSPERVIVAAVQMKMDLLDDGVAFAHKYYDLVWRAVERGAQLIVFPEHAWLPLLGLLPPLREMAQQGGDGFALENLLRLLAPAVKNIFEATASELAARFGVYLMPGTTIIADGAGRLFNVAYLYGPDGALIGRQPKLHWSSTETSWMTCGNDLDVWTLPFGKVAAPVGTDYAYWETTRIAALRGAEIFLNASADASANDPYRAARGAQARLQEVFAYGVGAYAVASLFGFDSCGPSYVAAPLGVWDDAHIFLARAKSHNREEIVTAKLDLAHLRKWRAEHRRDFNHALYRKYLRGTYAFYRARANREGRRIAGE